MLTVYELIFFFPDRKSYRDYHIWLESRRSAGEKIGCSHARANVVVCCLLFYKIYITPRAYWRVFAGNCFQHFPLLLFCSNSLSSVLGPILICTHCHLSCLPFTLLFWNNLFWGLSKSLFFVIDILVPDSMLHVASPPLLKDPVLQ